MYVDSAMAQTRMKIRTCAEVFYFQTMNLVVTAAILCAFVELTVASLLLMISDELKGVSCSII